MSLAPDLPGVVIGWRYWSVSVADGRPGLTSPLRHTPWEPGVAMVARCPLGHAPPVTTCTCGLYAVTNPGVAARSAAGPIFGCVALWGDIVEGTQGWRAAQAYPRVLIADPSLGELADDLAAAYGVRVYRSHEPPRLVAAIAAPGQGMRAASLVWPRSDLVEVAAAGERHAAAADAVRREAARVDVGSMLGAAGTADRGVGSLPGIGTETGGGVGGSDAATRGGSGEAGELGDDGERRRDGTAAATGTGPPVDARLEHAVAELLATTDDVLARTRLRSLRRAVREVLLTVLLLSVLPAGWAAIFGALSSEHTAGGWVGTVVRIAAVVALLAGFVVLAAIARGLRLAAEMVRARFPRAGWLGVAGVVLPLGAASPASAAGVVTWVRDGQVTLPWVLAIVPVVITVVTLVGWAKVWAPWVSRRRPYRPRG